MSGCCCLATPRIMWSSFSVYLTSFSCEKLMWPWHTLTHRKTFWTLGLAFFYRYILLGEWFKSSKDYKLSCTLKDSELSPCCLFSSVLTQIAGYVNQPMVDVSILQRSLAILESMVLNSHSLYHRVAQEITVGQLIGHLQVWAHTHAQGLHALWYWGAQDWM